MRKISVVKRMDLNEVKTKSGILKETVRCNNCGNDKSTLITMGRDFEYDSTTDDEFKVVRCQTCGLVYLNPRPAISELPTIYPKNYFSYSLVNEDELNRSSLTYLLRRKFYAKKFLDDLSFCPQTDSGEIKVLDVGCGDGRNLNWYRQLDPSRVKTFGVEMEPKAKFEAEKNGHTIFSQ